jgi:hypothetical protein
MPTLNWIGKDAVVNHYHQVPFHLLKDVPVEIENIWPADFLRRIRVWFGLIARFGRD